MNANMRRPTATLQPGKHGTWTVITPNGNAVHAETLDEARRIATQAGAILTRVEGAARRDTLLHTGNA